MSSYLDEVEEKFQRFENQYSLDKYLVVILSKQELWLVEQGVITKKYIISTASNGAGSESGSEKTPLGVHCIAEKIGDDAEIGTLFKARKNTHQIAKILINEGEFSPIDAITTRIMWLKGLEEGKNSGFNEIGSVDSYSRFIYIHGTDEEWRLGKPASHGCIRMSNQSVIDLYDKVCVNTLLVTIK